MRLGMSVISMVPGGDKDEVNQFHGVLSNSKAPEFPKATGKAKDAAVYKTRSANSSVTRRNEDK